MCVCHAGDAGPDLAGYKVSSMQETACDLKPVDMETRGYAGNCVLNRSAWIQYCGRSLQPLRSLRLLIIYT